VRMDKMGGGVKGGVSQDTEPKRIHDKPSR